MNGLIRPLPEITELQQQLLEQFGLTAHFAAECEFYASFELSSSEFVNFASKLRHQIPLFDKLEHERGTDQLEFALYATANVPSLLSQYQETKEYLRRTMNAKFSPKPYADEPGSGLHVHVHLEDAQGRRVFYKDDHSMSDVLKYSIAGMLEKMPEAAKTLWIEEDDIARIQSNDIDVPKTVSWGANNRSCAIRLPDKSSEKKHIEYRIAGANADLALVIQLMLEGILHGLRTKPPLPPQIHGNANDAQYKLKKLL